MWKRRWWKGICILGVALAFTLLLTTPALAWWNTDWKYRRPIIIQSENALIDYPILIELNSTNFDFSKANSDGSDIRFVDEDDATKLSYWIEEWNTSSESAKIWVKVPSIPAGEKIIYLYYGNPSAVSESNLSQVCPGGIHDGRCCEFFDGFEDGNLSPWIYIPYPNGKDPNDCAYPDISEGGVSNSAAHTGNYGAYIRLHCYDDGLLRSPNITVMAEKLLVKFYYKRNDGGGGATRKYRICNSTSCSSWISLSGSSGVWYEVANISSYTGQQVWLEIYAYSYGYDTDKYTYIDDVYMCKYVSSEPSVSIGGEEVMKLAPVKVTCTSSSVIQVHLSTEFEDGYILIGTSPNKFTYAYKYHRSGTHSLTTTFLQPNKTYYIKVCDNDGNCTDVVEFVCSKETELEKKNFTASFNTLIQGGNLLNISKLGETIPSVYTSLLTDMFWAMFFGGIFLAYWIRQEDVMLPSIVGLISGSVLIVMLPPSAQRIAYILLIISIAGTLYTIIKARR